MKARRSHFAVACALMECDLANQPGFESPDRRIGTIRTRRKWSENPNDAYFSPILPADLSHEYVLERNPSASEFAASTVKYARAKERYFVEMRRSMPTLIDMVTGKVPKTQDVDRIREIFSGYGDAQGKQLEAATISMLKSTRATRKSRKLRSNFTGARRWKTSFTRISTGSIPPNLRLEF